MPITPSVIVDLESELRERHFVNFSRSFDSNWLVLSSDKQVWTSNTHDIVTPPFRFLLHVYNGYAWESLEIPTTERHYHFVQALPQGRWLLAEARALGAHPNADVFDSEGRLLRSVFLGDGIEHLQVSASGDIWVGYFDEGVYGGGLERSGLICFDASGSPKLRFLPQIAESQGLPPVDDLYALNVCRNGDVWCSYYSDFPVVRLKGMGFAEAWLEFPKKAVRTFAVGGKRLLMVPAYKRSGPLYMCDLAKSSIDEQELKTADGSSVEYDLAFGRDVTLGFVSFTKPGPRTLYQVDFR